VRKLGTFRPSVHQSVLIFHQQTNLKITTELGAGDINRNLSGESVFRVAKTQYLIYMEPKSKSVTFLKKRLTVQSTDWTIEVREFHSLWGLRIVFLHSVHTGTGAHPAPYLMGTGAFSPELKWPGVRENNHSHPSTAEIKNAWRYTSTPKHVRGVINKYRYNFTFTY